MTTLAGKTRALVLGNLHDLLDRAIDLNSPAVVRQYVRDLGRAKEEIADQAAVQNGEVTNLQRRINQITIRQEEAKDNIELILHDSDPTNDAQAKPIAIKVVGYVQQLKSLGEELAAARTTAQQLNDAVSQLDAKYQEMVMSLQRLESLDRTAKAKGRAADALDAAAHAVGTSGADTLDNVTERLERRATVADARLERAMGSVADSVDKTVLSAQADELLAQMRASKTAPEPAAEK